MAVKTVTAVINGQTVTLTKNATSGKWEGTMTAPATTSWNETEHKYGITVNATDEAGNEVTKDRTDGTLGTNLQIRVLEKTKPTITITSPSSGAKVTNAKTPIVFQLRDAGSGIKIDSLTFKVDGGTALTNTSSGMVCTPVSGGYDCTYTPQTAMTDGSHTITINVSDNDNNAATAATTSFTVDTTAPDLNVSSPVNGMVTNVASLTVAGTASDNGTLQKVEIFLNGTSQGTATMNGSDWSKSITLSKQGTNTIKVVATDNSGLTTEIERTVTFDTIAPTIVSVTLDKTTVDVSGTFKITVEVTD